MVQRVHQRPGMGSIFRQQIGQIEQNSVFDQIVIEHVRADFRPVVRRGQHGHLGRQIETTVVVGVFGINGDTEDALRFGRNDILFSVLVHRTAVTMAVPYAQVQLFAGPIRQFGRILHLIVQSDQIGGRRIFGHRAGNGRQSHQGSQKQCEKLFHGVSSFYLMCSIWTNEAAFFSPLHLLPSVR